MNISLEIELEDEIEYITGMMNDNVKYNIEKDFGIKYIFFEYFTRYEQFFDSRIKECFYLYYKNNSEEDINVILISILYYFYMVTLIETLYDDIFPMENIKNILFLNEKKYKKVKIILYRIIMDNSDYISCIRKKLLGLNI
jgi:hypothetical protein